MLVPVCNDNIRALDKLVQLIISVNIVTVETEGYRSELTKVRAELEPWEKDLIVHKGKLDVASSESELLSKKVHPIVITVCLESRISLVKIILLIFKRISRKVLIS